MKNLGIGSDGGTGQFRKRSEDNVPRSEVGKSNEVAKSNFPDDEWMDDNSRIVEQTRQYRIAGTQVINPYRRVDENHPRLAAPGWRGTDLWLTAAQAGQLTRALSGDEGVERLKN